jgi:hypothetical protein
MSKRDRNLLRVAGLEIHEAATLLGRSRQALYQGIAGDRHYLPMPETLLIMRDAERRDDVAFTLTKCLIAQQFTVAEAEFLLPGPSSLQALSHAVRPAADVTIIYNGEQEQLSFNSLLMQFISGAAKKSGDGPIKIAAAEDKIQKFLLVEGIQVEFEIVTDQPLLLTLVLFNDPRRGRAFILGKDRFFEISVRDVKPYWAYCAAPKNNGRQRGNVNLPLAPG